jgi:single-strand DNA-binding protein
MARSINKVILVGNLGKDAETQFTQSGTAVTRFSVATSRRWKDQQTDEWKEETNWTNVVLWKQEGLGQYLTKGKQIYVEGRLQTRSYEDKEGRKVYATEVVANDVLLLGGKPEAAPPPDGNGAPRKAQNGRSNERAAQPAAAAAGEAPNWGVTDDDVPW